MTKAIRWGVSAMMIVGGVSLGAFAGCSSEEETVTPPVEDTGPGTDTAVIDTATTPDTTVANETGGGTETGTDAATDTPPYVADRAVTLLFAQPDAAPQWICLGAFLGTDDPATKDAPVQSLPAAGALGIPTEATQDPTKTIGFPYGAVVPIPLSAAAVGALGSLKVVVYAVDANPFTSGKTCAQMWATAKTNTKRWTAVAPNTIKAGEHHLVSFIGCNGAALTDHATACGPTGANAEIVINKLDTAKPTFGTGTGANVGIQFGNFSQFAGVTAQGIPGFQAVDVYIQPMMKPATPGDAGVDSGATDATAVDAPATDAVATDSALADVAVDSATSSDAASSDAATPAPGPTPAGAPIKIATNVSYKSVAAASVGAQIPGDLDEAFMVVVPTGTAYCVNTTLPTGATTCKAWWIPLKSFLAGYGQAPINGGFKTGTNQFMGVVSSPLPKNGSTDPSTTTLRVPFREVSKH